jgi:GT2 family glycosyltransferase
MVTGTLASCGYFMGGDLWPARAANPKGFFEGPEVNGINEALLAPVLPPDPPLREPQRWLGVLPEGAEVPCPPEIGVRIAALTTQSPFCFKDPRFCYTLPAWRPWLRDTVFVCVFRHPALTARSILEEVKEAAYLQDVRLDLAHSYRLWTAMYRAVLAERRRGGGDWLFLHFDQVLTPEGLARIAALTGAAVDASFPDQKLRRPPPAVGVPTEALALYAELCAEAGYEEQAPVSRPAPGAAPEIAQIALVDDATVGLLPRLVEDFLAQRGVRAELVVLDATRAGGLAVPGATVVRAATWSRGAALQAGLTATAAPLVAWSDPRVRPLPNRLAHQVAALREHPEHGMVLGRMALTREQGGFARTVDPAGATPPPFWQAAAALTRAAAARLAPTAFFPVELALYRDLLAEGAVGWVREPLLMVEVAEIQAAKATFRDDGRLLALARTPADLPYPELSVILCTYNRRDVLRESLEALCRQLLPPGTFEIVLVDDGSSDGTDAALADLTFPVPVTRLRRENGGLAAARNTGLAAARGRLVLLPNDDTIAQPDLVGEHLAAHAAHPDEKLCVLGTFEQPPTALGNALMRYLEGSDEVFGYAKLTAGKRYDGMHFWTCNVSVPAGAVAEAGGYDEQFRRYGCEDTDLGVRLERLGYRVLYHPQARAQHRHTLTLADLERRQRTVAQAYVRFFRKHPGLLARWPGTDALTLAHIQASLAGWADALPRVRNAAAQLAALDLTPLDALGGSFAQTAATLVRELGAMIKRLNRAWWWQGYAAGLEEHDLTGFPDLLEGTPVLLPEGLGRTVLVLPSSERPDRWQAAVQRWLEAHAGEEGETLLVRGHPTMGLKPQDLRLVLAALAGRATAAGTLPGFAVLDAPLRLHDELRLFAAMRAWLPVGGAHTSRHRKLAAQAGLAEESLPGVEGERAEEGPGAPWPLGTNHPFRLLCWPHWGDEAALDAALGALAPVLGDARVTVVLVVDPEEDGSSAAAAEALGRRFAAIHGDAADLDVLLLDEPLAPQDAPRLGRAVDAVVAPEGFTEPGRGVALAAALGVPLLAGAEDVAAWAGVLDAEIAAVRVIEVPGW